MKVALSLALLLSVLAGISVHAQTRTVTNADLEKFKQSRLQAERDYRSNYERMGFPSPAELEKQLEKSKEERLELAARLASERIELERAVIERDKANAEWEAMASQREPARSADPAPNYSVYDYGYYRYGYPYYFGGRYYRGYRAPRVFGPQTNVGNGIPATDYYGRRPMFGVPWR